MGLCALLPTLPRGVRRAAARRARRTAGRREFAWACVSGARSLMSPLLGQTVVVGAVQARARRRISLARSWARGTSKRE
jgi:hypothetical protein